MQADARVGGKNDWPTVHGRLDARGCPNRPRPTQNTLCACSRLSLLLLSSTRVHCVRLKLQWLNGILLSHAYSACISSLTHLTPSAV